MTYCVGLKLKAGLVLLSDTRTNAGVDNIARAFARCSCSRSRASASSR